MRRARIILCCLLLSACAELRDNAPSVSAYCSKEADPKACESRIAFKQELYREAASPPMVYRFPSLP